jgi:hypothetical protein
MSTTIVQVESLEGNALDWAVAKALGYVPARWEKRDWGRQCVPAPERSFSTMLTLNDGFGHSLSFSAFNPSGDWARGGPIIYSEKIATWADDKTEGWFASANLIPLDAQEDFHYGSNPLEAAMRCYVASKLGAEVEIPDVLINAATSPKQSKGLTP